MPKVPYIPYPTGQPQGGSERITVQTPGAAFGENVGAALSHLGLTEGDVGSELSQRAIAMKQVANENEARDLQAEHARQTAPLVADFDTLENKAAYDGLVPHLNKLQAIRENLAGTASNPAVRRAFLNDTAGFMQRETFSAGTKAGRENQKYTVRNINDAQSLNLEGVRRYPDDEKGFQDVLTRNNTLALDAMHSLGLPVDSASAELIRKRTLSTAWAHRISGKNDTDPDLAATWLEDHRQDMSDQDYREISREVKTQSRSISSTNIANDTQQWDRDGQAQGLPPKTAAEKVEHARQLAAQRHPSDPIVSQHAVTTLHGLSNTQQWEDLQQRRQDSFDIEKTIGDKGIQTIQQLKAQPNMPEAIKRMGPKYENDLPNRINNINKVRREQTNQASYDRIYGLMKSDPEAFLDTDFSVQELGWTNYKYFNAKKAEMKENPQKDLRVQKAIGIIMGSHGHEMAALGLDKLTESNKDDYYRFTGLLGQALDSWVQDNKKPASPKDIRDIIGPQIIRMEHAPGMFGYKSWLPGFLGGGTDEPFYRQDLTTKEAKEYMADRKAKVMAEKGFEPTDQQLANAYAAYQYINKYGKKAKVESGNE